MLTQNWRSLCFGELYIEAAINIIQGGLSIFAPSLTIGFLTKSESALCDAAFEVSRTFGALNFVFGGLLLLRVLFPFYESRALRPLVECLLIGDVVYLAAYTPFYLKFGTSLMGLSPYLFTLPMFICRLILRLYEDWESIVVIVDPESTESLIIQDNMQ